MVRLEYNVNNNGGYWMLQLCNTNHHAGDYTIDLSMTFNFASMTGGERHCIDFTTSDDMLAEGTEQFELRFMSITPSDRATEGDPSVVIINIQDDDSECKSVLAVMCDCNIGANMPGLAI